MIRPLDDTERRLRQLARMPLSAGLKDRVMAIASLPPDAVTWRDRVWYSAPWRLAAAAALLAVLMLDHWSAGLARVAVPGPDRLAVRDQEQATRLGIELGLSPEQARQFASRVEFVPLTASETRVDEFQEK